MLDEYYIDYTKTESPIFRLNGHLKRIKSFKVSSFQKLRKFLKERPTPLVYSLIYETIEDENGEQVPIYILNAYIEGVTPDPDMPFITDEDTKFAILSYVVNADDDDTVSVESIAIGDVSMEQAIDAVTEVYKDHKDFKLLRDIDRLVFKNIASY